MPYILRNCPSLNTAETEPRTGLLGRGRREGETAVHSGKGDGACEQLRNRDRPALGPSETPKDRTGFRGNGRHIREGCTEGKDGAGLGRTLAWGGGIPGGGHSPSGDVGWNEDGEQRTKLLQGATLGLGEPPAHALTLEVHVLVRPHQEPPASGHRDLPRLLVAPEPSQPQSWAQSTGLRTPGLVLLPAPLSRLALCPLLQLPAQTLT